MKIAGIPVGTTTPRADYAETNPKSAAFIKNKPDEAIQKAKQAADNAQTAAENAQTAAENAQTAADNAQNTADAALPKSGGAMTGNLSVLNPTEASHAANKDFVENYVANTVPAMINDALGVIENGTY